MDERSLRLELKEDKIIDILMHAATREDIAGVRNELRENITGVRTEIAGLRNEIKEDIAGLRNEAKENAGNVKTELGARIDKLDNKMDKVIWFIIVSILVPIFIQLAPHLLK